MALARSSHMLTFRDCFSDKFSAWSFQLKLNQQNMLPQICVLHHLRTLTCCGTSFPSSTPPFFPLPTSYRALGLSVQLSFLHLLVSLFCSYSWSVIPPCLPPFQRLWVCFSCSLCSTTFKPFYYLQNIQKMHMCLCIIANA